MSAVIARGKQLLASGRAGEAVQLLEDELTQSGGPALFALLGNALYQANRIADASRILADGVERFPFDASLQEAAARMRWMSGEGERFADGFLAVIASRPSDGALRSKCADLLRLAGQAQKAEQVIREGLARDQRDVGLGAALGVLLDETGRLEEAMVAHTQVISLYPNAPVLRLNLAHTLLRMGRADAAMKDIGEVRAAHPNVQIAITYEAMALKQLGHPKYRWLCDYERHVKTFDLAAPAGFSSLAAFNLALGACLRDLMDAGTHPLDQSLRGGSQTSHNLVADPHACLQTYFAALEAPISAYIDALGEDRAHPLEMHKARGHALSGCWSVLLRPGGFHVNHTHPQGWISSSYYVCLPQSVTGDSQEGWIKFGEPRWPTPGCGVERVIQPKEGRLVLFPSFMWHGTVPFSSGERLTAPFDVIAT